MPSAKDNRRARRDPGDDGPDLVDWLATTLGHLYFNLVALERAGAIARDMERLWESSGHAAMRVGRDGTVQSFSPRAAELVLRHWGARLRRGARPPAEIDRWLAGEALRTAPVAATLAPLLRSDAQGQLSVNAYPAPDLTDAVLLLMHEPRASPTPAAESGRWDLSARQRDVMRWLAAGKADRDIATILGISERTVQKHLQHVYAKLGVETRTAAVVRWLGRT